MPFLIPLPVILPALAAAGCLLFPRMLNVRRAFVFFTLLALAVLSATMLIVVDGEGIQTLQIGGWDAPLGITLVADRLSTMMLFVSSIILFAVMWFAIAQGIRDDTKDEPVAVFLPSYMLLTMGVNLSFLAGVLFNLYVGFEIFLVASYVLMTLGASPSRVRDGQFHGVPVRHRRNLRGRRHGEPGPDWPAHGRYSGWHAGRDFRRAAGRLRY